jgi:hypothetical protein
MTVDCLFRGQIIGGPEDPFVISQGQCFVSFVNSKEPGQTQVQNLDHSVPVDEQISWLNVPVNHAVFVRVLQTQRGLPADPAPGAGGAGPTATPSGPIKYQQVFHLTPENLRPYEAMSSPSLQQRWLTQPRRGELLAVSASQGGAMVGLAVAELFHAADGQTRAELISLRVLPAHASGDMPARLVGHLQKLVGQPLSR